MHTGRSLGLWYGEYFPFFRLRVMSRKLVTFRLQLMVLFRVKSRNVFVMPFRVRSAVMTDVLW